MNEIVLISGKGGTGKTSISASFALLAGSEAVIADCDVDAADMHLLLQPESIKKEDFRSGEIAEINPEACLGCGICMDTCRFGAITEKNNVYKINPISCEGCGYCARVCPHNAIINTRPVVGSWNISKIRTGQIMVHAKLGIGADNSGKLVAKVKETAKEQAAERKIENILIDGPPGIGCPVVSSLTGARLVVFITEPTQSGIHDLKRVHQLSKKFKLESACIINKADINPDIKIELEEFLRKEGIKHLSSIPYDENFTHAMVKGETIIENSPETKEILTDAWQQIIEIVSHK